MKNKEILADIHIEITKEDVKKLSQGKPTVLRFLDFVIKISSKNERKKTNN